jgi:hypothetical protein
VSVSVNECGFALRPSDKSLSPQATVPLTSCCVFLRQYWGLNSGL